MNYKEKLKIEAYPYVKHLYEDAKKKGFILNKRNGKYWTYGEFKHLFEDTYNGATSLMKNIGYMEAVSDTYLIFQRENDIMMHQKKIDKLNQEIKNIRKKARE